MNNRFAGFALALLAGAFSLPAFAQSADWTVDSTHSAARISVDEKAPAGGINLLLCGAGVSGSLHLDNADVSKSTVQFTIYPAGQSPAEQSSENAAPSTLLSFRSENAAWTSDGKLKVTGILTITHVEREATLEANDAYSGPVYTDRVVLKAAREESFVFAIPSPPSGDANASDAAGVFTSLQINREDLPELVSAVLATNWPAAAQEATCEAPPTASDGYSGTQCTGSQVIVPSKTRAAAYAADDYPGGGANSAEPGSIVTVALHLRLAQQSAPLSAKTGGQ